MIPNKSNDLPVAQGDLEIQNDFLSVGFIDDIPLPHQPLLRQNARPAQLVGASPHILFPAPPPIEPAGEPHRTRFVIDIPIPR